MAKEFDPARFSGKWYEIASEGVISWGMGGSCVTKEFDDYDPVTGKMGLYFRGLWRYLWGYKGVNGTLYDCGSGSADQYTCKALMGDKNKES